MENKYYIPDISDLFVGYILDYSDCHPLNNDNYYDVNTVDSNVELTLEDFENIGKYYYRTKYLDKEDIESLGWEYDVNSEDPHEIYKPGPQNGYLLEFENGNTQYFLYHWPEENLIHVEKTVDSGVEGYLYKGYCKSINELKTLMSWLKIK